MAHTYNTDRRRTVNRGGTSQADWDSTFNGERFGNHRKMEAGLKVRRRRIERARAKSQFLSENF